MHYLWLKLGISNFNAFDSNKLAIETKTPWIFKFETLFDHLL